MPRSARTIEVPGVLTVVLGWGTEPAFSGSLNAVVVSLADRTGPLAKAEGELSVEVTFGTERVTLALEPVFNRPHEFHAPLVPTRSGTYTFHVTGRINKQPIDITSTCGESTFHCVTDASAIQFPVKDPSVGQLAERIDRSLPRADDATAAARSARLLAIAALGISIAGVAAALTSVCGRRGTARETVAAGRGHRARHRAGGVARRRRGRPFRPSLLVAARRLNARRDTTDLQLTFVERPEPSLSTIRVSDTAGVTYQTGSPEPLAGDPLTLTIGVSELPRGVYTVQWRVVSAIDGHATVSAFAFGVQVAPTGPAAIANSEASLSWLEVGGRSLFLLGLIVALGAATFAVLPLGPAPWIRVATFGTFAAAVGLVLLSLAQWRAGGGRLDHVFRHGDWTHLARARRRTGGDGDRYLAGDAAGRRSAVSGGLQRHRCSCRRRSRRRGRLPVASTVIVHAIHVVAASA